MTELVNVEADEVSLVDSAANRKRLLLYKAENGGAEMPGFSDKGPDLLGTRINTADQHEDAILGKVGEIRKAADQPFGEEERDTALALLRVAGSTDAPAEKRAAMVAALMGTPDKVEKQDAKPVEKTTTKPDPTVAELVKAAVAEAVVELRKEGVEKDKHIDALLAQSRKSTAVAKAAKTQALGSRDKLADIIEKAEAAGFGEDLVAILTANGEAVAKSRLFLELGSSAAPEGSALAKMEALARERVAKSTEKETFEQALVFVGEEHPELYRQYTAERGEVH